MPRGNQSNAAAKVSKRIDSIESYTYYHPCFKQYDCYKGGSQKSIIPSCSCNYVFLSFFDRDIASVLLCISTLLSVLTI